MILLKYEFATQLKNNTSANARIKTIHAREISILRYEIKNKSNEIRKLKISRAMRKSKKNPIKMIEKTDDIELDEDAMENKERSRAV